MMWEREPSHTIDRNKQYSHYGKKQLPQKVKYGATMQLSHHWACIQAVQSGCQRGTCASMFIATLLKMAKTQNQSKCLPISEIKKI